MYRVARVQGRGVVLGLGSGLCMKLETTIYVGADTGKDNGSYYMYGFVLNWLCLCKSLGFRV